MCHAEVSDDGRFLILYTTEGCLPVNRVSIADLDALPKDADGAIDFGEHDVSKGKPSIPLTKASGPACLQRGQAAQCHSNDTKAKPGQEERQCDLWSRKTASSASLAMDLMSPLRWSSCHPCDGPHRQYPSSQLVDNWDASYSYVANDGSSFTWLTNLSAPKYRVVRCDVSSPTDPASWDVVVPEVRHWHLQRCSEGHPALFTLHRITVRGADYPPVYSHGLSPRHRR